MFVNKIEKSLSPSENAAGSNESNPGWWLILSIANSWDKSVGINTIIAYDSVVKRGRHRVKGL